MLSAHHVSISGKHGVDYPKAPPFHPHAVYPEYPFRNHRSPEPNPAYEGVRDALSGLGLDRERYGTASWNPLGSLIREGSTVLIKPNLVLHEHPRGGDIHALITHASVIRAVLDYVFIAMKGRGRIIIGDSPLQTTDFGGAIAASGLPGVLDFFARDAKFSLELVDFRQVIARRDERGHIAEWCEAPGDPAGTVTFDLGAGSLLHRLNQPDAAFRVSNYRAEDTAQYHGAHSHRYVIARSVFDADVVMSVPKLKTHCKVGVTLGLKNFVGTVSKKQCLAHHRAGGPERGGDEFPHDSLLKRISEDLERRIDGNPRGAEREALKLAYRANERMIKTLGLDSIRDGGWSGNDTAWRMTLDLARILAYGRRDGTMADSPQRTILTIIDGIIGGEGEGPLEAIAKPVGCVMAGLNPAATDIAVATFMGFDYRNIPLLHSAMELDPWPLAHFRPTDIKASMDSRVLTLDELAHAAERMSFREPLGWRHHMELGTP
ncbi:MAG: DUF362 domain-containing protein [bacterium]